MKQTPTHKGDNDDMEEYLCLIRQDENEDWFLLCVRETLYCISCGPLSQIKESIRNIKKRYHTSYGLSEALHNMSERAKCNEFTFSARKAVYDAQKGKYDYILRDVLEVEYEKVREKRKPKKTILVKTKVQVQEPKKPVSTITKKKPSVAKKVMKPLKSRRVEFE